MILIDLTHTAHTTWQSGIQIFSRNLYKELVQRESANAIVFDKYLRAWRMVDDRERRLISDPQSFLETKKHREWSFLQRKRGQVLRMLGKQPVDVFNAATSLIVPEINTRNYASTSAQCGGPSVAIFHDAIPLRKTCFSPRSIVEKFPLYLEHLKSFDGIAAVSESSRDELLAYWEWQEDSNVPPVTVIHPGNHFPRRSQSPAPQEALPLLLFVSTIEDRKNHLGVLEAAEVLWSQGHQFELCLVGNMIPEMKSRFMRAMEDVKHRPTRYLGNVPSDVLHDLYKRAYFTLYPSFYEGYGMPVLESLSFGKPCVVTENGGLRDIVRKGGCEVVNTDAESIAGGMRRLLSDRAHYEKLCREAAHRDHRTWTDYIDELLVWMESLGKRCATPAIDR